MALDEAYRRAEEKIEEARRSGTTELDLNGWGPDLPKLTELPESLGHPTWLRSLDLSGNQLMELPERLGHLTQLRSLNLSSNLLTVIPESLHQLTQLESLYLSDNQLTELPEWLGHLTQLRSLNLSSNLLTVIPESLGQLTHLESLYLTGNQLTEVPVTLGLLTNLRVLELLNSKRDPYNPPQIIGRPYDTFKFYTAPDHPDPITKYLRKQALSDAARVELSDNPLNPELAAVTKEGIDAIKRYLYAKAGGPQIALNEAKLILVGEGEVGKSCLLGALRGDEWVEGRPTTHGIEIKPVKVTNPDTGAEITLNGWDFDGQRVYRPTHQLFFSAPAVYLIVWKPREGPQQGFIKEWIKLVKHRAPDAKILVVATHGGPSHRQPDLDRQQIWDLFGRETVLDFFHVESKPDGKTGQRQGIVELTDAIARVAASLPEMGRTAPAHWQQAREVLKQTGAAYMPLEQVLEILCKRGMGEEEAQLFVNISHRLGHLIHYEHDPALRDIVVLKPDWLATAISFVLDDKKTRDDHGLVGFARLSQLWNDPMREEEFRYDHTLHPLFLRLMERFDLSYKVALPSDAADEISFWQRVRSIFAKAPQPEVEAAKIRYTSLIAQLVPDVRPEQDLNRVWPTSLTMGDKQQVQICRIVDIKSGQPAAAEGLFYQLIVRLHKFSLGRVNYGESVHWQRGLALDDDYNGRALLEHIGDDIRITVRAPYPERLLSALTYEVEWLVDDFWEGLRCDVMVPCLKLQRDGGPCPGLFEVRKLIENKRRNRPEQNCIICNEWQDIESLLHNAPAVRPRPTDELFVDLAEMKIQLSEVRQVLIVQHGETIGRFDKVDVNTQRILSKVDDAFNTMMQTMLDEAKEGPRLFSFQPVASGFFDLPTWLSQKFRLTLWCEHSRLPLPSLNEKKDKRGVYELDLPRDWFVKAAPFLKVLTGTLSLVLPVASSAVKLPRDDAMYKSIEKELDLAQRAIESVGKGMEKAKDLLGQKSFDVEHGEEIRAQGAILRQLHALFKQKDPAFGGLVRVRNKRQEFLWVHPQFEGEY